MRSHSSAQTDFSIGAPNYPFPTTSSHSQNTPSLVKPSKSKTLPNGRGHSASLPIDVDAPSSSRTDAIITSHAYPHPFLAHHSWLDFQALMARVPYMSSTELSLTFNQDYAAFRTQALEANPKLSPQQLHEKAVELLITEMKKKFPTLPINSST